MANGNLGAYLRNTYGQEYPETLKESLEFVRQGFEESKNFFSPNIRVLLEKKIKEFERKARNGEWIEANLVCAFMHLTGWAAASGMRSPEKRAKELEKESYRFARKVLKEVKKRMFVQDEERIIRAVAVDLLADFMWGISDGPLNLNSSLLAFADTPENIQRCVEDIVKYLEEIAAH